MANSDSSNDDLKHQLQKDVFPPDWKNPEPRTAYDLLVIGGGPGGMTAATIGRRLGATVAIVEKEHFGGECLSYGCIPSKAFLRSSRAAQGIRKAKEYGLDSPKDWKADFKGVMQRVHQLQTTISPHDSVEHFKKLGIDVFLGVGRFIGPTKLEVNGQKIQFRKAIIVTGTQPIALNAEGIEPSDYLTNQNIFSLLTLPERLAVIGGGPISCELSQAFLRFGSQVTLITRGTNLLPKDDPKSADLLRKIFEKEGMKVLTQSTVQRVEKRGKEKVLYLNNSSESIVVDEILVAIGRKPAVEGLDLEKAGVNYDKKNGIETDDHLQTSNPYIYASGDVTSRYKFTHVSKELSKIAVLNALNGNQEKSHNLIIPWCTYTDPEIAHVGLSEQDAKDMHIGIESVSIEMKDVDRAILDGETTGFAKVIVKENSNQILGATIMSAHAGDMISEVSVVMDSQNGLHSLAEAIHPFPTQAQVLRTAAETLLAKRDALQKV